MLLKLESVKKQFKWINSKLISKNVFSHLSLIVVYFMY